MKIEKILVPTDFSANAEAGLRLARDMAEKHGGKIVLVHVSQPYNVTFVPGFGSVPLPSDLQQVVGEKIDEGFAAARQHFADPDAVETVRLEGDPATQILDYAQKENVGLIVVATHGHTGFERLVIGSVAEKIVRLADCPVLTVRPEAK